MTSNELIPFLRVLGEQPSWRYSKLAPQITRDVLNELDRFRLIEVRLWSRSDEDGATPVPNWRQWYIVRDHQFIAGTLDQILDGREYQGSYEPEIRVSPRGAEWMLDSDRPMGRTGNVTTVDDEAATPLTGDETTSTVNKMLENDPPWEWKKTKAWLQQHGVTVYTRQTWKDAFGAAAPKTKGNPALVNEAELNTAIRDALASQKQASEYVDSIDARKAEILNTKLGRQ